MKFYINSKKLLNAVEIAGSVTPRMPVIQALEDLKFRLDNSILSLVGSDLEVFIETKIEADQLEGGGEFLVPYKTLKETLKALPDDPLCLTYDSESNKLKIDWTDGEFNLACHNAEDFPECPATGDPIDSLSEMDWVEIFDKTGFAMSTDELRQAMCGVCVDGATFVATDAHKLSKYGINAAEGDTLCGERYIIPKNAVEAVKKAFSTKDEISYHSTDRHAVWASAQTELIARKVDQKYPDYDAVMPDGFEHLAKFQRDDLQNALKRAMIYSDDDSNQVELKFSKGRVDIKAKDVNTEQSAEENIPCSFKPADGTDEFAIGFNAKYLSDILSHIPDERVRMELTSPQRAAIVMPDEEEQDSTLTMLIMPIVLNY